MASTTGPKLVAAGLPGIGILMTAFGAAAAVVYLFGADACLGLWSAWYARAVARFMSMADRTDRLTAEFVTCAEDGSDRPRFVAAVQEMLQLSGDLGGVPDARGGSASRTRASG